MAKYKISLPYAEYTSISYDTPQNLFGEGGYEKMLDNEYNSGENAVFKLFNDVSNTNTVNVSFGLNNGVEKPKNVVKTSYGSCLCDIKDDNFNELSYDDFKSKISCNDGVILFLKLDYYDMDEEFETELKMWVKSHNKISSYKDADDSWKFNNEPSRDIKISFDDEEYMLNGCKILDVNNDIIAILCLKISSFS